MKWVYVHLYIYQDLLLLALIFLPLLIWAVFCVVSQIVSVVRRLRSSQKRLEIHAPVDVLQARKSKTEEGRERRVA